MKTGVAELPLHAGRCPKWLFPRMKRLGAAITRAIVEEHGEREFLRRISNPFFFQSLGCALAFDWHSSGLTTTVCGALKEGLNFEEHGIAVAGGKGKTSRKAPEEIFLHAEAASLDGKKLVRASKLAAKVDGAAVQDGFQLYHHCFFLSREGGWAVVQQGLRAPENAALDWLGAIKGGAARRYHWLSEKVKSFVEEPHSAVCCNSSGKTLNMVAAESEGCRKASLDALREGEFKHFVAGQTTLALFEGESKGMRMQRGHLIDLHQYKALEEMRDFAPENYEEMLCLRGMGPKSVRALALIAKLVYGEEPSWRDPARYSFAHGGKDGTPRPVDCQLMIESAHFLEDAVEEARLGKIEKEECLKRLSEITCSKN
ncbi:MAG: DUF763 domain-containing protein [Candidatus Norongarragalinales archaeon]